ncbi:integrase/recombinase XerD [Paraburkholderia phenoliruptrix]|nr:integrase/recombinase XerD [Paraburkholderia phenoliruptrix]
MFKGEMKQAKTFTEKELKQVLTYISLRRHALRNRAMVLLTHWAGMRVGEVAALLAGDVVDSDGSIKSEIRLAPEQTKGRHARTVFLGQKLRRELAAYVASSKNAKLDRPLFYTQKRAGFTANTLCQYFHWLYKNAGIQGASSHSGRRSFITKLASKGVGVRVLMSLAGHRDISTTQRYIDVNDDMQRKAVDLL